MDQSSPFRMSPTTNALRYLILFEGIALILFGIWAAPRLSLFGLVAIPLLFFSGITIITIAASLRSIPSLAWLLYIFPIFHFASVIGTGIMNTHSPLGIGFFNAVSEFYIANILSLQFFAAIFSFQISLRRDRGKTISISPGKNFFIALAASFVFILVLQLFRASPALAYPSAILLYLGLILSVMVWSFFGPLVPYGGYLPYFLNIVLYTVLFWGIMKLVQRKK